MKAVKTLCISFLSITFLCWLSGCTDPRGELYSPHAFSYNVDGTNYSGGLTYGAFDLATDSFSMEFYEHPVTENFLTISFSGASSVAPGSYVVGYNSDVHALVKLIYYSNGSHPYTSTSGNLTITSADAVHNTISGTFQFTGKYFDQAKQITAGSFDGISYQKQ